MIEIVGKTTDGKLVVSGAYKFFETHGLPLEVVFQLLQDHNAIPCWQSFYREAQTAGMKHDRILAKLEPAIADSYGTKFKDYVLRFLEILKASNRL